MIKFILNQRGPFATLSLNLLCLRLYNGSATVKKRSHNPGISDIDKRVLFSYFYCSGFLDHDIFYRNGTF